MKNLTLLLALSLLILGGCKKTVNCVAPTVSLQLADKQVQISVSDPTPQQGYEIEWDTAGFTQSSGHLATVAASGSSFTVPSYGTYDVFIRKKCFEGATSEWSARQSITVDGSSYGCQGAGALNVYTGAIPYTFQWISLGSPNFYDVEYGPTGFTIGHGTRERTNLDDYSSAIMHAGITYDFYVRANCGGNSFSPWAGPRSIFSPVDQNISQPCTTPTNLYAYYINSQEINYTSVGHGSVSYEIAFSTSGSTNNGNIISTSSPNGTVGSQTPFTGTYYFWIRGKCDNGSFTSWEVSQVQ
jgi:hypothetical protein